MLSFTQERNTTPERTASRTATALQRDEDKRDDKLELVMDGYLYVSLTKEKDECRMQMYKESGVSKEQAEYFFHC